MYSYLPSLYLKLHVIHEITIPYMVVHTQNGFNKMGWYLGSQLICIVGLEFPIMGNPLLGNPIALPCFYELLSFPPPSCSSPYWYCHSFLHGFKNRTEYQTVFFLISGSTPVFARFLTGCWPVLRVLTGPDWLPVPSWTGRTDRSGPIFKTVLFFLFSLQGCQPPLLSLFSYL